MKTISVIILFALYIISATQNAFASIAMQMYNENDPNNPKVQGGVINDDIENAKKNEGAIDFSSREIKIDLQTNKTIACYKEKTEKKSKLSAFQGVYFGLATEYVVANNGTITSYHTDANNNQTGQIPTYNNKETFKGENKISMGPNLIVGHSSLYENGVVFMNETTISMATVGSKSQNASQSIEYEIKGLSGYNMKIGKLINKRHLPFFTGGLALFSQSSMSARNLTTGNSISFNDGGGNNLPIKVGLGYEFAMNSKFRFFIEGYYWLMQENSERGSETIPNTQCGGGGSGTCGSTQIYYQYVIKPKIYGTRFGFNYRL